MSQKKMSISIALALLVIAGPVRAAAPDGQPLFVELPPEVLPAAVGAGGFVVVGSFFTGGAALWNPIGGAMALGGTYAVAVSRDGKTVVGRALDAQGKENAAIWQGGQTWRALGSFTPEAGSCDALLSAAYGASADGRVIVGLGWDGCRLAHAFRWEESTGMKDLGSTVDGRNSRANDVSGDGRVVAGWQENPTGFWMGAKWVGDRQELIQGPSGVVGEAATVNRDGSLIAGQNCEPTKLDGYLSAWTWRPQEGVRCHPYERPRNPQGKPYNTLMLAASDDGRVIGGSSSFGLDAEALVWFDDAPVLLEDYLRDHGYPDAFKGWVNTGFVTAVTPDGRTLFGNGAGPRTFQGYMVVLPELGPRASAAGKTR